MSFDGGHANLRNVSRQAHIPAGRSGHLRELNREKDASNQIMLTPKLVLEECLCGDWVVPVQLVG